MSRQQADHGRSPTAQDAGGFEELDDVERPSVEPMEVLRFVVRAAGRHWLLGMSVALVTMAFGISMAVLLPRKYRAQSVLLVNHDNFMFQVNPERLVPRVDEFRGAVQRMFRQDNLRAIVRESELETLWVRNRPPLLRFKDHLLGNGLDRLNATDRDRVLRGTLERRLTMETDQSSTITIGAVWTDPETAIRLVEVARRRFLEDRLRGEIQVYEEVLAIQEEQAKVAARNVERFLRQVEKLSWYEPPAAMASTKKSARSEGRVQLPEKREPDPFLVIKLEKVREQIQEMRQPWERRVMELKLQLTDLKASYAPKHPLVIHQEARLREASVPPPELEALQAEERSLTNKLAAYSGVSPSARTTRVDNQDTPAPAVPTRIEQSATISAEQAKLIQAINKYNDLSEHIASTRLEITAAETAFKHRYLVAADAEKPDTPLRPKLPWIITLGSILLGLVLGIAAGPLRELLRGRIIEPWQVKRLGLPVIGEISYRSLPSDEH